MKKVITGEELYLKEEKALELLCKTVKKTLGPRGSNAIIDHSLMNPFITNDGVTIARNIESDDECVNTILTLAKEASIKTDENVGDGTTTTLVLLESIFKNGIQKIREGKNPHILKKELDQALEEIISKLKKESKHPSEENYYHIASIAANDENMGNLIANLYIKLHGATAIRIEEGTSSETYTKIINGYTFDTITSSPYFFNDKDEIVYKNPYLLVINKEINDIEEISEVINYLIDKKVPGVIFANDYTDEIINEILSLNFNGVTSVMLLKTPEYGTHQMDLLKDLEVITNGKIVKRIDEICLSYLGKCEEITINKETVLITSNLDNERVKKHIAKIKREIKNTKDEYEINFLNTRLAKLTNGIGTIYVGASTTTETREKKMRFDDALNALKNTSDGILPGSGLTLLKIKENLQVRNNGYEILKESLDKPFLQILENVGIDKNEIYTKIKESNYNLIYNVLETKFEKVTETKVVDPTNVVMNTLKNAVSIAGMLLTTSSLIINEYQETNYYNKQTEI